MYFYFQLQISLFIFMANSVIKGFSSFFISLGKFILLALLCGVLGFAIVWPLWFFAVKSPNLYSFVVILLLVFLVLFFLIRGFLKALKQRTQDERKSFLFNIFRGFLLTIICIGGLILSISLVMNQLRLVALITFLLFSLIFGVCAIVIKKK